MSLKDTFNVTNDIKTRITRLEEEAAKYNGGLATFQEVLTKETNLKQKFLYRYSSQNNPTFYLPTANLSLGSRIILVQLAGNSNTATVVSPDKNTTIGTASTITIGGLNSATTYLWLVDYNLWVIE